MSASTQPKLFWFANSKNAKNAHAMKLINVAKGKLLIAQEGQDLLRGLPAQSNLNLIFIFGNARSGKSFLMNALAGVPGLFTVANSSLPCTKGVDISSAILPYQELEAHTSKLGIQLSDIELHDNHHHAQPPSKPSKSSTPPQIGFVDVEGQGAEDSQYDTMLALPLLLTSKVILFNHKGAPTVNEMLTRLGVLARAAEYIDIDGDDNANGKENGDDTDGSSTNRVSYASQRLSGTSKKFGHLHVIFRDFSFEGNEQDVYQQLLGLEPVQPTKASKTTKSFNPSMKSDRDRENDALKAVQERNDIRNLLHENFQSIHIWLLKQPASGDVLKQYRELPEEHVDPAFTSEVHRLQYVLTQQLQTPTLFAGSYLNGTKISTLLTQITQTLNTNGAISVPSVFKAMENETVNRVYKEIVDEFEKKIQKIKSTLPISTSLLQSHLTTLTESLLMRYDTELEDCVLIEEREKRRKELELVATKYRTDLAQANHELLLKLIRKIIADTTNLAKMEFDTFCSRVIPIAETQVLQNEWNTIKSKQTDDIKKSLRDHPESFDLPEYKYAILERDEALTEYLSFKLIQNDAQVKDEKITRLQEEAIAQQKLLIEQNRRLEQFLDDEKKTTSDMEKELARLRQDREEEKLRAASEKAKIEELNRELELVRKKKKGCVIL